MATFGIKPNEKLSGEMAVDGRPSDVSSRVILDYFGPFKQNQKRIPFVLPDETIFTFLFCFDYFVFFHVCLGDLHLNNKISELNYNKLINTIKN